MYCYSVDFVLATTDFVFVRLQALCASTSDVTCLEHGRHDTDFKQSYNRDDKDVLCLLDQYQNIWVVRWQDSFWFCENCQATIERSGLSKWQCLIVHWQATMESMVAAIAYSMQYEVCGINGYCKIASFVCEHTRWLCRSIHVLPVLFHLGSPRVLALQEYLGDILFCSSVGWEQRGCVVSTVGR